MSTALEKEIQQLFRESGDAVAVADQMLKRWDANLLPPEDVRTLTRFLVHAGLYDRLFNQVRKQLKTDGLLPWSAFIESLHRLGVALEPIEIDAIFEGVNANIDLREEAMDDLVESRGLDSYDARPKAYRQSRLERLREAHKQKREDLMRRLDYARVNRLISQEKRILDEIQAYDPDSPELRKEKKAFRLREAQDIVESALAQTPPKAELERKFSQLSPELKKAAKPIIDQVREKAKTASEAELYDLALMLVFMELHQAAIAVLEPRRLSERIDWLLLEVQILGRQYAAALGEIEKLEVKYAGHPESPFALTYARARALWGLGETVTAIELMRSLNKVRPSYRSASTLMQQWLEEAP